MPKEWTIRLALPVSLAALVVLMFLSLAVGDMPLGPREIVGGLFRQNELAATILWQMRLPRMLAAILVGGALSAGGLVMQAYFRNSLASPGLLGVSSGGAAGAVVAIALGWSAVSIWTLPVAAIFGAGLALAAVVGVLMTGVVVFAKGGEANRRWGNRLMNLRVATQFLAVLLLGALMLAHKF